MPPKTVALVAAVCVTAGWVLAAVLTPPVAKLQALPERRQPAPPAADQSLAAGFTEHLQLRLRSAPEPPRPRRNPFRFGSVERAADATAVPNNAARAIDGQPVDAVPPVPAGPLYTLAGMGITEAPEGTVRTAVLGDGRSVHLVKVGDVIGGYTVTEMTDRSVTLSERSGVHYVLTLR